MDNNYSKLDEYILSAIHELEFGTFEMVEDGRSKLLKRWYEDHKLKINNIAADMLPYAAEDISADSAEDESSEKVQSPPTKSKDKPKKE